MVTTKEYFTKNKERVLKYQGEWRRNNPQYRQSVKRWNDANPEKMSNYRDNYNRSPKGTFARLKSRAKYDGTTFTLERDRFIKWYESQGAKCYYCKSSMSFSSGQKKLDGYSIDRKDNNKGYTHDNIVLCCNRCNLAKGSWFTGEQMLEIAQKYFQGYPIITGKEVT